MKKYKVQSMSTFHKYHKILNKKAADGSVKACWSEKIHGANMRIRIGEDGAITYGSRERELDPEKNKEFMNFQLLIPEIEAWANRLHEHLKCEVYVFGEMFGHKVQKEIEYGPGRYFRAFDIRIDDVYVNARRFEELCTECNIPRVTFHYETWEECMAKTIEGVHSPIAQEISGVEVEWEGIVVRVVEDTPVDEKRRIVKRKVKAFSEVAPGPTKVKLRGPKPTANEEVVNELRRYITRNRLINVLSHGNISLSNKQHIAGVLVSDALEEYVLVEEATFTNKEAKRIKAALTGASMNVVNEYISEKK